MGASNFQANVDAAIEAVRGRTFPGSANMGSLGAIGVGVLAVGYGLATDVPWTMGAMLTAIFYGICVAQGAVMFSVIMHGTYARWGRPLKRIGESFVFFLPVAWLLLTVFLVAGGATVYPWHPDWVGGTPVELAPHGDAGALVSKPIWLEPGFFIARQIILSAVLFGLSFLLVRTAMGPDLALAKQKLGADAPAWWDRFIGGITDVDEAAAKAAYTNQIMVPVMGFAYALVMSMLSFDLVMSLDPWWYSNMFGGWIFMSSILLGLCAIGVWTIFGLDWLSLRDFVTPATTHDLGKLMLAGTMFWAYTLFAQILPIYYTDVPEETNFLLVRMLLPQWSWMAQTVAVLCFVTPFTILLSRGIKKMRWPFAVLAMLLMTGLFLERTLLVMPSVHLGDVFPWTNFIIISFGALALVAGLMVQVVGRVLASVPAVPVADPLLEEHPWDVHVHGLDHAAH